MIDFDYTTFLDDVVVDSKTGEVSQKTKPTAFKQNPPIIPNNKWHMIPESIMNEKIWLLGCAIDNPYEAGKRPHLLSYSGVPKPASINVTSQFMTYDEAVSYADENSLNLGFVHTATLNICTLDADIKDDTPENVKQTIYKLFKDMDSYTELSNSGKGLHCIIRTEQLVGIHPNYPSVSPIPLEIYSYNRFMLTTGREVRFEEVVTVNEATGLEETKLNVVELSEHEYDDVYRKIPSYREAQLTSIIEQIGGNTTQFLELIEVPSEDSDEVVLNKIYNDHNSSKFIELCELPPTFDFTNLGYPSCSEVDLFIIGQIAKQTPSNAQVHRIFKQLPIAQRDKHQKGEYHINKALIKIRTEIANSKAEAEETDKAMAVFLNNINDRIVYEKQALKNQFESVDKLELETYNPTNEFENMIPFPHGTPGEMCQFLMDIAPHKLPEACLAGTLAWLSAVLGRQYQHNGAGLNNYYVVVAPSATGKETARRGVGRFASATSSVGGDKFICFDTMASKQGYLSFFSESETLSNLVFVPEFSKIVSAMQQKQNNTMQQIYSFWLEVFPRSARGDVNGGNLRANSEDSTKGVSSPALTLMCDTTPDDYYEQITEQMQRDGFMSRFVNIECYNPIKKLSDTECHKVTMTPELASELRDLCAYVLKLKAEDKTVDVQIESTIRKHIRSFEMYTLEMVNKTRDERYRQPYNRCFLKIMTIASLLAIMRNKFNPIINMDDFEWSKSLIMRDVYNIVRKLDNGTFGSSDDNNEKIVKSEIKRLLFKATRSESEKDKYGELLDKGVVPRSALTVRINQYPNFGRQNQAKTETFDKIMYNFEKNGWIRKIDKHNRITEFKNLGWDNVPFFGDCYALQNGSAFSEKASMVLENTLQNAPDDNVEITPAEAIAFDNFEVPTSEKPARLKPGRKPKTTTTGE
jgi:primase-polymerase (primpol)-like protein